MKYFTIQDNRRLARSALAAIVIHAAVFIALTIFIAAGGAPVEERVGMITLNLEPDLSPAPSGPATAFRGGNIDAAPVRSTAPKPDKPKADESQTAAIKAVDTKAAPAAADKNKTGDGRTLTVKDGAVREPASGKGTKDNASPSRLEQGSLARLDEALLDAGDGSGAGGGGGGGGSRAATNWEDRAARALLSRTAPVIPRWVSEQGLRLKVELAVELNADGLVLVREVKVSSGYPDVDAAVAKAVSRWKYSRGAGTQSVRGTITYFIELK